MDLICKMSKVKTPPFLSLVCLIHRLEMMLHKYCFHIFEAPRLHRGGQGEELL